MVAGPDSLITDGDFHSSQSLEATFREFLLGRTPLLGDVREPIDALRFPAFARNAIEAG
jgi:hypothetical protein